MSIKVVVLGGSGYVGGELLRILANHPDVTITAAGSVHYAGEYVHRVHPNLKGVLDLKFSGEDPLKLGAGADVIFCALPHGSSLKVVPKLMDMGVRIVDMSADFRLTNAESYKTWYGYEHPYPDLLKKFVYGLAELHREQIKGSRYIAAPGCMAAAAILALAPIAKGMDIEGPIVVDAKIGSSGAGGKPSLATHFSERFGVVRPYKPVGHRHTGEIEQEIKFVSGKDYRVAMSAHAVNMVRGILSTSHVFTKTDAAAVWKALRSFYISEPFIRFIRDKAGLYRYPDPKIVIGSNFADIGFEVDPHLNRLVMLSAIDNLIKGAAGSAVQAMNLSLGLNEKAGLGMAALHPV